MMKKLDFTKQNIKDAILKAKNLKQEAGEKHKAESICGGKADLAAYFGEEVITNALGANNISTKTGDDKYDFDLWYKGWKFDVKLKRRLCDPIDGKYIFDASVADSSLHQKTDGYIFLSITFERSNNKREGGAVYYNPQSVWFCGFMGKKNYLNIATHFNKGDIDPSNNWKVTVPCNNVPYKNLLSFDKLLNIPQK